MNIDDLKATEDKRISDREEKQQTENKIKELLKEEEALWKKADVLYNKFMEMLKQEFIDIFKEKEFIPKLSTDSVKMVYKEKSISFEKAKDCSVTFYITNDFEKPSYRYSYNIEPIGLNLNRDSTAYLYEGEVYSINEPDLQKTIENLSKHLNQLRLKINDLDNWKLVITPFDKTIDLFGSVKFNNIEEVVNAILNRER